MTLMRLRLPAERRSRDQDFLDTQGSLMATKTFWIVHLDIPGQYEITLPPCGSQLE